VDKQMSVDVTPTKWSDGNWNILQSLCEATKYRGPDAGGWQPVRSHSALYQYCRQ